VSSFAEFGLSKPILTALAREGHKAPTPIQAAAIPALLKGRDLLGIAQTGTGKTAAFALPILNHLAKDRQRPAPRECRVLVLTPTRELAVQVEERFKAYGAAQGLATGLVIGGVAFGKQRAMLHRGLDILVATPGRLIDVVDKGALKLSSVEVFVLDEVDQMLDLGFIHSIRAIAAKLPEHRQNVFFSATMPPAIAKLASALLTNPVRVEIEAKKPLKINESVIFVEKPAKAATLIKIVKQDDFTRGLVFTRTKHGADKLVRALNAASAPAHAIHGNRSQVQRQKALDAFRNGRARILVATDIAARGIDVPDVTHVVNYDLPMTPETYTHRIGRTGRAGAAGVAVSFCSNEEKSLLRAIEKLTRQRLAPHAAEAASAQPANDERPSAYEGKRREDRAREDNLRADRPREDRPREDRPRDGKPREYRSRDERQRGDRQREDRQGDERRPYRGERSSKPYRGKGKPKPRAQEGGEQRQQDARGPKPQRHQDARGPKPQRSQESRGPNSQRQQDARGPKPQRRRHRGGEGRPAARKAS